MSELLGAAAQSDELRVFPAMGTDVEELKAVLLPFQMINVRLVMVILCRLSAHL